MKVTKIVFLLLFAHQKFICTSPAETTILHGKFDAILKIYFKRSHKTIVNPFGSEESKFFIFHISTEHDEI